MVECGALLSDYNIIICFTRNLRITKIVTEDT